MYGFMQSAVMNHLAIKNGNEPVFTRFDAAI